MAKAKTATVNRTIRIPCSDEEILDAIVEKLSQTGGFLLQSNIALEPRRHLVVE